MRNQLERASSSIALNLSEGRGRKTLADQKHFFQIAYGSARERKAILELADLKKDVVYCMADNICAHIYRPPYRMRSKCEMIKEIDVWGVPLLRAFFCPTSKFFSAIS